MGRLFEHPVTLIVLLLVVVLLFGAKRLPDLASGIGQSLRIFKREVRDLSDDDKAAQQPGTQQNTAAQPPVATQPPTQPPVAPAAPVTPPAPQPTEHGTADPRA